MPRRPTTPREKSVDTLTHDKAKRINNPTAEMASLYEQQAEILGEETAELRILRDRPLAEGEHRERDADRDPQIVWGNAKVRLTQAQIKALMQGEAIDLADAQLTWRGKDQQDWSDLIVNAPSLYIQEKVHPKAIIDDLKRGTAKKREDSSEAPDLFADFNGLDDPEARAEFYQHSMHWQNRMILGDSLQVMASLAEREALKGQVQCIYFDPPYGIKFNSNWQVSTLSRDVKDGKVTDVSREPEQVKAFRDTWKDGIHSYLTYLRDRLMVARELLTESGSIFVQIGDENVHRVRALMDEVFGEDNFVSQITLTKAASQSSYLLPSVNDFILWYARQKTKVKYRTLFQERAAIERPEERYICVEEPNGRIHDLTYRQKVGADPVPSGRFLRMITATSQTGSETSRFPYRFWNQTFRPPGARGWSTGDRGLRRVERAGRMWAAGTTLMWKNYHEDYAYRPRVSLWDDIRSSGFGSSKVYIVQTLPEAVQRCILMATDPGDLVLDPTCGSGTTATVAEQWGRRWITIDTSRVALALARTRLMSARYPYYLLADSQEGREKEQAVSGKIQTEAKTHGDIRQGFVYERAPHITLKSIANNAEIDVIWEKWQARLEPLRDKLNAALSTGWEEWQIPRDLDVWLGEKEGTGKAGLVTDTARKLHADWWKARIARQKEIDDSIAKAADVEMLYDRPYEDKARVRVAGPFTVESLSPHRVVTARDDTLADEIAAVDGAMQRAPKNMPEADFGAMVLENLKTSGVHQQAKADTIHFSSLEPWPGNFIAAVGTYSDGGGAEKRAGVLIGPEFGTLSRSDITAAAREAADARFDALVACAFNFDAQASDLTRLGPLAILKARMNPDLHMAEDLKNTGKGNLFVVFGEPDVELIDRSDGQIQVKVHGVDVFDPSNGEIRSDGTDGIAVWFIDTDYDEESFFVRQAYFLGAAANGGSDPYKSLKTALKTEIDRDAWETLYSDVSRPFPRPATGRIAVKVINHFGDEVLKVFGV
ncbi:site-specific DNA-methyltransferase [Jiella marina]|uniref:site-specific DNA-methyltransferase n=1 Tax=Jiella sp. LLJ827 TaxID=2917712 RepID=UPI0021017100|nr:site-specific DNA-methyltransferase [Jiella sp. LLJ827]MCQ0987157.1 site-specific DNA-methyltransferase [Jiella sp. LLJ827]